MQISEVPVPEVYERESADFRFFLKWFETALTQLQYDTTNFFDLFDPLRCPEHLLWMLADTMGFKRDDRLPTAFNRLVLLYFMSMIRNRGSKTGITLAAEVNLAQFNILKYAEEKEILANRLEDTNIPVNAVYVAPNVEMGYIELVYFADKLPIDACIEYVRPLGMYLFPYAGVRMDARTKISVDARLTDIREYDRPGYENVSGGPDINTGYRRGGPTRVGHYHPEDYAMMQKTEPETRWRYNKEALTPEQVYVKANAERAEEAAEWAKQLEGIDTSKMTKRQLAWYRNSKGEIEGVSQDAGYRAMESLQLTNNQHIVESLIEPIFSIGHGYGEEHDERTLEIHYLESYLNPLYRDQPLFNLRYNRELEESLREASLGIQNPKNNPNGTTKADTYQYPQTLGPDIYTIDPERTPVGALGTIDVGPAPKVNPAMYQIKDAMNMDDGENKIFTKVDEQGRVWKVDKDGNKLPDQPQYLK